eukprot:1023308-Amphidinium_carterae.2
MVATRKSGEAPPSVNRAYFSPGFCASAGLRYLCRGGGLDWHHMHVALLVLCVHAPACAPHCAEQASTVDEEYVEQEPRDSFEKHAVNVDSGVTWVEFDIFTRVLVQDHMDWMLQRLERE